MISKLWKSAIVAVPVIGTIAAFAAFTSPPFNSTPTYTAPMIWQCYSAMVERTSAVCESAPVHPTNVIPSRGQWCLVQYKSQLRSMADSGSWAHPALPQPFTNRLNSTNVLTLAGLPADFWTNTPPPGLATATNGWHGLRRVLTNFVWTVASGVPSDCNGSNVSVSASGFKCSTNPLTFGATADGFPLYEARNYSRGTNNVYKGHMYIEFVEDGEPCDNDNFTYYDEYDFYECAPIATGITTNDYVCIDGALHGDKFRYTVTQLSIISDACDPEFALGDCPVSAATACAHVAPVTFPNCSSALTNVVFDAEEYYNSGATGSCIGAVANFNDPFGVGLVSTGWAKIFTYSSAVTNSNCRTNFANATTRWSGSEVTNAWVIYGAVVVKKWRFDF